MAARYAFLETAVAGSDEAFSPVLRSSLAHRHRAAGARFEERGGWLVAAAYPGGGETHPVAVVDVSHVGKLELLGGVRPDDPAVAEYVEVGPAHHVVVGRYADLGALRARLAERADLVVDRTSAWCGLLLAGESAGELLRGLSHIEHLPGRGPIGKVPATILRRPSGIWLLFSQEYAQYGWDLALDLALPLGGAAAGVDDVVGADPLLD